MGTFLAHFYHLLTRLSDPKPTATIHVTINNYPCSCHEAPAEVVKYVKACVWFDTKCVYYPLTLSKAGEYLQSKPGVRDHYQSHLPKSYEFHTKCKI